METKKTGVTLTQREAEEYCVYKRQRKISEIMSAMRQSENDLTEGVSATRTCENAVRLRQTSVRVTPSDMVQRGEIFKKGGVKIDCLIGGNGETFVCVKAYEAKRALKAGAKELTLVVTPSFIANSRYQELRRELRKLRRVARKAILKARVECAYPPAVLSRVARACADAKINYFSLPYFEGCERVQADLSKGCRLEVYGVDTLTDFQKMTGAGVGRIVSSRAWDIYREWMEEVGKITVESTLSEVQEEEKSKLLQSQEDKPTSPKYEQETEIKRTTFPRVALIAANETEEKSTTCSS